MARLVPIEKKAVNPCRADTALLLRPVPQSGAQLQWRIENSSYTQGTAGFYLARDPSSARLAKNK